MLEASSSLGLKQSGPLNIKQQLQQSAPLIIDRKDDRIGKQIFFSWKNERHSKFDEKWDQSRSVTEISVGFRNYQSLVHSYRLSGRRNGTGNILHIEACKFFPRFKQDLFHSLGGNCFHSKQLKHRPRSKVSMQTAAWLCPQENFRPLSTPLPIPTEPCESCSEPVRVRSKELKTRLM